MDYHYGSVAYMFISGIFSDNNCTLCMNSFHFVLSMNVIINVDE